MSWDALGFWCLGGQRALQGLCQDGRRWASVSVLHGCVCQPQAVESHPLLDDLTCRKMPCISPSQESPSATWEGALTGETGKVNPTPKGCITLSKFLPLSLDLSVLAMVSSRGALKVPLSGIPGGLGGEHVTKRPLPH